MGNDDYVIDRCSFRQVFSSFRHPVPDDDELTFLAETAPLASIRTRKARLDRSTSERASFRFEQFCLTAAAQR